MISSEREKDRLIWSRNGTLLRRPSIRHYIPKHPFYYTSSELFDTQSKTESACKEVTRKFVRKSVASNDGGTRAFTAPVCRKLSDLNRSNQNNSLSNRNTNYGINRPQVSRNTTRQSGISSYPATVAWLTTPIPGIRTIEQYDLHRRDALDEKNTVLYRIKAGLLPKYMGYVPGNKFRYGSPFGMLTYNAKEIEVQKSATWGGAVSLF